MSFLEDDGEPDVLLLEILSSCDYSATKEGSVLRILRDGRAHLLPQISSLSDRGEGHVVHAVCMFLLLGGQCLDMLQPPNWSPPY